MSSVTPSSPTRLRRALTLLALILAGESAFFLPFLLARVFRPTVLEVFDLTNLELGTAYGVYGVVAMLAYLAGGPLADRYSPRVLLAIALLSTASGGLALVSIPSINALVWLYAFWGVTTIALFWAPLIKATRVWGGEVSQGKAFGLLDGGRGLLSAVTGSIMVAMFATLLPAEVELATQADKTVALRSVILLLMSITVVAAALLWWLLPHDHGAEHRTDATRNRGLTMGGIARVAKLPTVWLQACIILCAYVGFRAVDDFPLYASEVLGMDDVEAAQLSTLSLWMRPLAAVAAGIVADRLGAGRITLLCFVLLALGSSVLAAGNISAATPTLFLIGVVATSLGVFALRGLYYAIMQEGRVPLAITGSAVGVVSLVGYTPDVFMGPLMGYLLDSAPGALGHQRVFWVVTGFAVLGAISALLFQRVTRNH